MAGGSKQQSNPKDVTPESFKRLQQPFADVITQLIGGQREGDEITLTGDTTDVLRNIPTTEGPFAAPIAAGESATLQQLQDVFSGGQFDTSRNTLEATARGDFLTQNPFLEDAIAAAQRTTLQGLEETLSRTLPGRFTQAGQFVQPQGSSAFDRAAALATRGVASELSDIAGQLSFAGFESERGRQQEAAVALPSVTAAEVEGLVQNLQAQALPRMIEQFGIEGGLQAFNNQVSTLLAVLGLAQGTGAPVIANTSSGKSKGSLAPFFQAGATAVSGSDRRFKKDVVAVGQTANGLNLYMFRYIWEEPSAQPRLGLMADEVEKVAPEAVYETATGFKFVDYAKALGHGKEA